MYRREFVAGSGTIAALSVAGCIGNADTSASDGGSSGGWAYDETVTSDDGDIHEALIGELEKGDRVEVEVIVNQGRHTRFELLNRDTGEFSEPAFVYRDSRIEGYDSKAEDHVVSPFRETYTITEFGEYYARFTLLASGLEVRLRFRELSPVSVTKTPEPTPSPTETSTPTPEPTEQPTGEADISIRELDISLVNDSDDGDTTDVRIYIDVEYIWAVPDAKRWIVNLLVGPNEDNLKLLTFRQDDEPADSGSGTLSFDESVLEADAYSAEDFESESAGPEQVDIVVGAEFEVRREGADPLISLATEEVSVSL